MCVFRRNRSECIKGVSSVSVTRKVFAFPFNRVLGWRIPSDVKNCPTKGEVV